MTTRVLVVDDDRRTAQLIARLLAEVDDATHDVVHVGSWAELARLLGDGPRPDVALVALGDAGATPADVLEQATRALGDVPVVAHSRRRDRATATAAVAAGAADHVAIDGHARTGEVLDRAIAVAIERHRSQRAIADALAEAARANEQLQRVRQAQDDFVAIASHELRTPVTVASGFVRLLSQRDEQIDPHQRRDLLARACVAMGRLQALTDDLVTVSRGGHRRIDPSPTVVALGGVVHAAVASVDVDPALVRVAVDEGLHVVADEGQLTRVLRNLLDNAVRHGRPPVEMAGRAVGDEVRLTVTDHGGGVPPSFVPTMFDQFTQADTSTSRPAGGTGLGLAIVRALVEAVGGRVDYAPAACGGASFTVTLRAAASPDRDAAAGRREPVQVVGQA